MKYSFLCIATIALTAFKSDHAQSNVELVCLKTLKASNTCHFNFKIDDMKYHYVDMGCKFSRKKDEVIDKAKEGSLALAKDWKLDCPAVKATTTPANP